MAYDPNSKFDTSVNKVETEIKTHKVVAAAIAVVIALAIVYLFYANNTNQPIFSKTTVEQGYNSTKSAVTPNSSSK